MCQSLSLTEKVVVSLTRFSNTLVYDSSYCQAKISVDIAA
jgi:hypothetical protein